MAFIKTLEKFRGKDRSLFLMKLQACSLQLYYKKKPGTDFSCKFCSVFKNNLFIELLRATF